MFLIGFEDNLIPIHHLLQLFSSTHSLLTILLLLILLFWWWGLEILLNLRPIVDDVMVTICDHSLLLLWALLLLLLLAFLVIINIDLTILLWKIILLSLLIISIIIIIIIWGALYFTLTVYYFVLFIVVVVIDVVAVSSGEESVTVCSLWRLFRVLFVKFILTGVEFWQVNWLFILKCLWRVIVFWWRGNLVWEKFAFVIFVVPLILLHGRLTPSMRLLVLVQQGHQFLLLLFNVLLQYLSRQITPEHLLYFCRCLVFSLELLPYCRS